MNNITTRTTSSAISTSIYSLKDRLVRGFINSADGRRVAILARDIRQDEWAALAAREAEVTAHMQPARSHDIAKAVSDMMVIFPSTSRELEDGRAVIAGYTSVLSDLPLWAIQDACRKWMRGEVAGGPSRFAPSAPELRMTAEKSVEPLRAELHEIASMKSAEVPPAPQCADMRERVAERFKALAAEMQAASDAAKVADDGEEQARAKQREWERRAHEAACAKYGIDPDRGVTPALLKSIGRLPHKCDTANAGGNSASDGRQA